MESHNIPRKAEPLSLLRIW